MGTSRGTIVLLNVNSYLNPRIEEGNNTVMRTVKSLHDQSVNSMRMSRTGNWLVTGEKNGAVKYLHTTILFENQEVKKNVGFVDCRQRKTQRSTKGP